MELHLAVTSHQRTSLGLGAVHVFGTCGGTIGRARDNDWILPDAERIVSAHHARIFHDQGAYFIEDTSANGTGVNARPQLTRGQSCPLQHGDVLNIGDYRIQVALLEHAIPAHETLDDATALHPAATPTAAMPAVAVTDRTLVATGMALTPSVLETQAGPAPAPVIGETAVLSGAAVAPAGIPAAEPGSTEPDGSRLMTALFEGLGLEVRQPLPEASEAWFRSLGALLRIVTTGALDTLRSRAVRKSEFRLAQTIIHPTRNNPLKFSVDTDQALRYLFIERIPGFLDAESAFAESFRDLRRHEAALGAGMRAACARLLREFAPETIAASAGMHRMPPAASFSGPHWEAYQAYYRQFVANAGDDFQGIFGEEFVRAYEDCMRSADSES